MWNMPVLSTFGLNYYPLVVGSLVVKSFDQGWAEYFGSQKIYISLINRSKIFQIFMLNRIKIFFILTLMWVLIIFMIYLSSLF